MSYIAAVGLLLSYFLAPQATQAVPRPLSSFTVLNITMKDLSTKLTLATSIPVLADRRIQSKVMDFSTDGGPLDTVMTSDKLVWPKDVSLKILLLPPVRQGGSYDVDAVANFSIAQEGLVPSVSSVKPEDKSVIFLGKSITREAALQLAAKNNLRLVYVLVSSKKDSISAISELQTDLLKRLMSMSPEDQAALADQNFDTLMRMDPQTRKGFYQQTVQAGIGMLSKVQQLPPAQRQQFFDEIRGVLPPGLNLPPPGLRN